MASHAESGADFDAPNERRRRMSCLHEPQPQIAEHVVDHRRLQLLVLADERSKRWLEVANELMPCALLASEDALNQLGFVDHARRLGERRRPSACAHAASLGVSTLLRRYAAASSGSSFARCASAIATAYLVANSLHHTARRTFALDGFRSVEWLKHDRFDYPADYNPSEIAEGAFGLIRGDVARVRIFFDERVARFVRRRKWHPTQHIRGVPGGIELTMEVAGTVELTNWVLGFGDKATVLEPIGFREQIREELRRACSRYEPDADN